MIPMFVSKKSLQEIEGFIQATDETFGLSGYSSYERLGKARAELQATLGRAEAWPLDLNLELQLDGRISNDGARIDVDRNLLAALQKERAEALLRASLLQGLVDQCAGMFEANEPLSQQFPVLHETLLEHSSHQK
jgi:hypothetical protein